MVYCFVLLFREKNTWYIPSIIVINFLPSIFIFRYFSWYLVQIKFRAWEILWYFARIIFREKNKIRVKIKPLKTRETNFILVRLRKNFNKDQGTSAT